MSAGRYVLPLYFRPIHKLKNHSAIMEYGNFLNGQLPDTFIKIINEFYSFLKTLTAFVLVFPPIDEDDKYYILPFFWLPEDTLPLRVRRNHVPYDVWERQGYLLTIEGNVVHYGFIENFIEELGQRFNIREIAFDRWGAVLVIRGRVFMMRRSCWYCKPIISYQKD